MNSILRDIENPENEKNKPEHLYIFAGQEEYLKRQALEALRMRLLTPGFEVFDETLLEDCDEQTIIESAEILPVGSEYHLVVVRDWSPLLVKEPEENPPQHDSLKKWLADIPETCCLVFYFQKSPDTNNKLLKYLEKNFPSSVKNFNRLKDSALKEWCINEFSTISSGKKLKGDAAKALTEMVGDDLTVLRNELLKVASFIGIRNEAGKQDVEAVVSPSHEYYVYRITDELFAGKTDAAYEIIHTLIDTSVKPISLLAMITSQFRMYVHIRSKLDAGIPVSDIRKILGIKSEWALQNNIRRSQRAGADALKQCFRLCVQTDFEIKQGMAQTIPAIDSLILRIGSIIGNNAR